MAKLLTKQQYRYKMARMDVRDWNAEADKVTGKRKIITRELPDGNAKRLSLRLSLADIGLSPDNIDRCMAMICRHDTLQRLCTKCAAEQRRLDD
jgi:hypothetical protein